jgi:transcriptional regulator NrdR family protein
MTPSAKHITMGIRGLVCRNCGCQHFQVLYTRPAWGGRLLRRRACRHCGRRITTYEQTADAPPEAAPVLPV